MNTISSSVTLGLQSSFLNTRSTSKVSNNQEMVIASVLKDFNPEKLSTADAKKITSALKKLGVEPGPELEATMSAKGFDARKVGDLAFGRSQQANNNNGQGKAASAIQSALAEFKDLMAAATDSAGNATKATSGKESKAAADAFLNTLFSAIKSQEQTDQSTANAKADAAPKAAEVEAGREQRVEAGEGKMARPDGPAPGGGGSGKTAYSDSVSAIAEYLKKLIAEFNTDTAASTNATNSTTSTVSASSFSGVVNSVNNLFAKNGIAASTSTMTDFLQILQSKMQENTSTTGNFVDAQV
jgi:hypothetical protein